MYEARGDNGVCKSPDSIGVVELEDVLHLKDLERLKKCFENPQHTMDDDDDDDDEEDEDEDGADDEFKDGGDEPEKGGVTKDNDSPRMSLRAREFLRHAKKCLKVRITRQDLVAALEKLEGSNKGLIVWEDLCCHLDRRFRHNDHSRQRHVMPLRELPAVFNMPQNRRQMTVKMLISKSPSRLLTFTQKGIACSWNPRSLKPQRRIFLFNTSTTTATGSTGGHGVPGYQKQQRRSENVSGGNVWISDVILMEDCHKMAVASSRRDVRIFDLSTALSSNECPVEEEYYIHGLPNWTSSMEYTNSTSKTPSSHLLLADDKGRVHDLEFLRPTFQLFPTNHKQGDPSVKISFEEMTSHDRPPPWNSYLRHRSVVLAGESISRMKYFPEQDRLIVGSSSPSGSVTVTDLYCKRRMYRFDVAKGITCFDYDQSSKVLIAGSSDRLLRVWDGYVTERPLAILQGHRCGILDVTIDKGVGLFFSLSRDGVLKIWDAKEFNCLQTCSIKFRKKMEIPKMEDRNYANDNNNNYKGKVKRRGKDDGGFSLEFSNFPMVLDAHRRRLIVTCGSEMASIELQADDDTVDRPPIKSSADEDEGLPTNGEGLVKDHSNSNEDTLAHNLPEVSRTDGSDHGPVDSSESGAGQKPVEIINAKETRERFKRFAVKSTLPENLEDLDLKTMRKKMADRVNCSVLRREVKQSCPFSATKLNTIDFEGTQARQQLIEQSLQQKTKDCFFTIAYDYHSNDPVNSNAIGHKTPVAKANEKGDSDAVSR